MVHKKIIEDIVEESGCNGKYCLLKEVILYFGLSDRQLEQIKLVEKFKYEESKNQNRDIGWEKAFRLWISLNYAKRFDEVYRDGLTHKELWDMIFPTTYPNPKISEVYLG